MYNSIVILNRISYKSSDNVSDGDSNITEDIEAIKSQTSKVIKELANDLNINTKELNSLSKKIETVDKNINVNSGDKETLTLRYSLLFAIKEIESNLTKFDA